jgi:hypothetical protein
MCGSGHKEGENIEIKVLGKIGVYVCVCVRERESVERQRCVQGVEQRGTIFTSVCVCGGVWVGVGVGVCARVCVCV